VKIADAVVEPKPRHAADEKGGSIDEMSNEVVYFGQVDLSVCENVLDVLDMPAGAFVYEDYGNNYEGYVENLSPCQ